jgi:hypothetical protein
VHTERNSFLYSPSTHVIVICGLLLIQINVIQRLLLSRDTIGFLFKKIMVVYMAGFKERKLIYETVQCSY